MKETPQNSSPDSLFNEGVDYYHKYQWSQAKECFNQALNLYQQAGIKSGEAKCIWMLGDISYMEGDYDK
jgi:outer membrane protein assembly factor BamD (BamD/ComL family)